MSTGRHSTTWRRCRCCGPSTGRRKARGWWHDSERQGDIADLLVCRGEERLGIWPVDLSGGSGLAAAGGRYPARQLVVDREDRGDLEKRPGYRDEGFPVCGFNSPGQLSRVFGRVPDRNANF